MRPTEKKKIPCLPTQVFVFLQMFEEETGTRCHLKMSVSCEVQRPDGQCSTCLAVMLTLTLLVWLRDIDCLQTHRSDDEVWARLNQTFRTVCRFLYWEVQKPDGLMDACKGLQRYTTRMGHYNPTSPFTCLRRLLCFSESMRISKNGSRDGDVNFSTPHSKGWWSLQFDLKEKKGWLDRILSKCK